MGYAQYSYNQEKTSGNVTVYTRVNSKYSGVSLTYSFNGQNQTSNVYRAAKGANTLLNIIVYATKDGNHLAKLVLDPLDFIWNHPQVQQSSVFKNGQKGAIVELFGWPYTDIE